ncbi:RNA-binding protein 43 [Mixophyes fleayi]|uniref:RNA-binding protein 43 n=1 Tax=Mixophyes fleayi TaxID=3061075 RepID=UPI003F4D7660
MPPGTANLFTEQCLLGTLHPRAQVSQDITPRLPGVRGSSHQLLPLSFSPAHVAQSPSQRSPVAPEPGGPRYPQVISVIAMADRRVLQVSGIPSRHYEDDLVRDKLLIHFLQFKNGGSDVDVRYPTEREGVAMLTFHLEEVAKRVLDRKHILTIAKCTYPLEVRRPLQQGSQFSMHVKTFLDLAYFSDVSEVMRLLEHYNLKFNERGSCLLIEGDFCDLRRCRKKLYEKLGDSLLRRPDSGENQAVHVVQDPSKVRLTPRDKEKRPPKDNNPPTDMANSRRPKNVPELRNHSTLIDASRQRKDNFANPSANPPSPKSANEPSSALPGVTSSSPMHSGNNYTHNSLSSSLYLDPEVYTYIMTFQKPKLKAILHQYSLDMKGEDCGNIYMITFTAKSPNHSTYFKSGFDKMTKFFAFFESRLRSEEIKLTTMSAELKEETKSLPSYLLKHDICSCQYEDSIKLIGPSENIHRFMQEWNASQGESAQPIREEKPISASSRPPTGALKHLHLSDKTRTESQVTHQPTAREPGQRETTRGKGRPRGVPGTHRKTSFTNQPWK